MTDIRLLYVTTANVDQARALSRSLLERQLIACANILPQMESLYRWQGEIKSDTEAVVILKTEFRMIEQVKKAVLELHSYDTPCILTLAVESGAEKYIEWLKSELG